MKNEAADPGAGDNLNTPQRHQNENAMKLSGLKSGRISKDQPVLFQGKGISLLDTNSLIYIAPVLKLHSESRSIETRTTANHNFQANHMETDGIYA